MAVTAHLPGTRRLSATVVPAFLAVAVVACQIAYPHVAGAARNRLTVATVLIFFCASVAAAWVARGPRFAALLAAVTAGGGFLVEAVGVATGIPFGAYTYSDTLGLQLLGVPLVIPLAWTMMGYPALVVGRTIARGRWTAPLAAGAALASWDLFLDPQMVDAGHWSWAGSSGPELVGVPVVNFIGWLVVATIMMAVLLPATRDADDRVPVALYLWTYVSSVLAHAVLFDLPASAVAGGVGMGAVVAAFAYRVRART